MKRFASLQARLLVLVLALLLLAWLGTAALLWRDARHEIDELLDGHLAQAAALLVVQQAGEDDDEVEEEAPVLHKYAPRVAFQVFHEGRLLRRSAQAGVEPMSRRTEGFDTVRGADGREWRVFAARGAQRDVQVYVGERLGARRDILLAVLRSVLLPLLAMLPVLMLALWWAVRQGLLPLRRLEQSLTRRQPGALEPLALDDMPSELRAPVAALNDLLARIAQLIEHERRFTADAAHELRTPIAAIRAQAQVALGAGADNAVRTQALQATLVGCDRATHLVEQLLQLARLEQAGAQTGQTDLHALAQQVAAELAPQALAAQQTLTLEADGPCPVAGEAALWRVLLRNLLDNALRYSPRGAQVRVRVQGSESETRITVEDSGPGLSDAQIARLGERFFRVLGGDQPGSGLGWSIVRRVSQVLGARVEVGRAVELGGLRVVVCAGATENRRLG